MTHPTPRPRGRPVPPPAPSGGVGVAHLAVAPPPMPAAPATRGLVIPHDTHAAPLLGAYFGGGADVYYRVAVPVRAAGGVVAPFDRMGVSQVAAAETVVISRLGFAPGASLAGIRNTVMALREDGGRVVLDFDDDPWSLRANVRARGVDFENAAIAARNADALTCTNEFLAARLRRLNRDVRVVPNYIRAADWPEPVEADGPVTVVLAGSQSHVNDWHLVVSALRRLRERGEIRVRVAGYCPDYLRPLCDDERPWAGLNAYQDMLAGAHIGLCPLPTNSFNKAKSPIKAYEYALAGLAVVASPCQYGPVLRAAGLGEHVVTDVGGDWYGPLTALVRSAETRRQAAQALRQHVLTLDAANHAAAIRAAYAA